MPLDKTLHQTRPWSLGNSPKNAKRIRCRIVVEGTVQGVGFRPFIYGLANSLQITGIVSLVDSAGCPVIHQPRGAHRAEITTPGKKGESLFLLSDRWMDYTWELLSSGAVIAIKSLGGFHLACDGSSEEAIMTLRRRKNRPFKPLAVMCRERAVVEKHCLLSEAEYRLLASPAAPVVLLRRRETCRLPAALVPNLKQLGVMLPYTPLHKLLFQGPLETLVMTSGNCSGLPLAADNLTALRELQGIADYFLFHDRDIVHRCADSVATVVEGETLLYRRSRGYVPLPVTVAGESERPAAPETAAPTETSSKREGTVALR